MTRFCLLLVGVALAAGSGCAQCDTCDDFPAPCTGPNCGQNMYATGGFIPPTQDGLPAGAARTTIPADDAAPAMNNDNPGANPSAPSPTMPPTAEPSATSPPAPNEPGL